MPRILLIDDDERYRRLLKQHLSIVAAEAEVVEHAPSRDGTLPSELTGAGYDYVILGAMPNSHSGLSWLKDLTDRPRFPPVIYVAETATPKDIDDLERRGAIGVLSKTKIDHLRLRGLIDIATRARRETLKLARQAPDADKAYRFGDILIRGERCIRQIASSALSTVYLAESEKVGRLVVLKVFGQVPGRTEKNNTFDRFLQEYQIIAGIAHPNVVRIYDLGVADDHAYITMEYFRAGDLRMRIRRGLDPNLAGHMLRQMAEALAAIHSVGVLHRDLKPGNVMLRDDGTIVLIDFGLAKQVELDAEITATGEIFGTPYYMSPEQGHGKEVDERSDIYSLGIIFYEMLTGQKPFLAPTPMAVIYKHSHAPLPELPAPLGMWTGVLGGMLAKSPGDRYASAREVVAAVDEVLSRPAGP
jgi:DNA-binding response OmpR family regulator